MFLNQSSSQFVNRSRSNCINPVIAILKITTKRKAFVGGISKKIDEYPINMSTEEAIVSDEGVETIDETTSNEKSEDEVDKVEIDEDSVKARICEDWLKSLLNEHSNALLFYKSQNSLCRSNFLCQTKIYLDILPVLNLLCNCKTKKWFAFSKLNFWVGPTAVQFLIWHKIFGPAQAILGHVEGQGISFLYTIQ